jgi:DNA repair exonuclease SbcCD ATPase subunit
MYTSEDKTRLESEKLQAEIDAIRKPYYRQASFYAAISPIALAIIGLIFTWSSGWFDMQRTRIANEKTLLEAENSRLQAQKETLVSETAKLEASRISLNDDVERLNQRRFQQEQSIILATNELSLLQKRLGEKEDLISVLNSQVMNLTKANTKLQPLVAKIDQLQTDRDKYEKELFLARSHLAHAHQATLAVLTSSGTLIQRITDGIGHPEKAPQAIQDVALFGVEVGKWRGTYDADRERFNLTEFLDSTNNSSNTLSNSATKALTH